MSDAVKSSMKDSFKKAIEDGLINMINPLYYVREFIGSEKLSYILKKLKLKDDTIKNIGKFIKLDLENKDSEIIKKNRLVFIALTGSLWLLQLIQATLEPFNFILDLKKLSLGGYLLLMGVSYSLYFIIKTRFEFVCKEEEKKEIKENNKKFEFKERYPLPDFIATANIKGKRFPYIVGLDENGKLVIGDLKKDKGMIIAGAPGGGKSVLEGVFLQSFNWYVSDMFHIMVDFKGGVELSFYEDFDNTICVETVDDLIRVLDILEDEMNERYALIRKKYQDIDKYNANVSEKEKRPAILVTIDEFSEIRLNAGKKKAEEIEDRIVILQNKGRAALIYFAIATQRPDADQFDPRVKANCQKKYSFRVADKVSQNIVGVKDTENLGVGYFKSNEGKVYYGLFVDMEKENRVFNKLLKKKGGCHVKLKKDN